MYKATVRPCDINVRRVGSSESKDINIILSNTFFIFEKINFLLIKLYFYSHC